MHLDNLLKGTQQAPSLNSSMILDIFDFDLYLVYLYPIPERLSVESTPIRERGRQIEDSRTLTDFSIVYAMMTDGSPSCARNISKQESIEWMEWNHTVNIMLKVETDKRVRVGSPGATPIETRKISLLVEIGIAAVEDDADDVEARWLTSISWC